MNHNKTIFLSILVSLSGLLLNCENEPVGITFTDSDGDGVYDAVDILTAVWAGVHMYDPPVSDFSG